ncbi:MAG: hypothetical protein SPK55_09765 [Succinivibrio sp.]|jgi:3-hydroxymyristoyl/3-hydroxydecanoyl-(acyl carrier protein) dehydratase|nr:hypothetical protein [Succinivibrio sp.]
MIKPQDYKFTEKTANSFKVNFTLNEDLFYLQGHFPTQKLLPGVVQLGYVVDFCKELLNLDLGQNIPVIKFVSPIVPHDSVELNVEYNPDKSSVKFAYTIHLEDGTVKDASNGRLKLNA